MKHLESVISRMPFSRKADFIPPKNEIDNYYLNNYGEWKKKPDMTKHFEMKACINNAHKNFKRDKDTKVDDVFNHIFSTCVRTPADMYYFRSALK